MARRRERGSGADDRKDRLVLSPIRILEGSARGRRLYSVPHREVRPALARVRNSVFNILRGSFEGRSVADVYAGTGAVGFEALSRGAARCAFVERAGDALAALRRNAEKLGLADRSVILACDALRAAATLALEAPGCACVFVDPPYALWDDAGERRALAQAVEELAARGVLAPDGRLVMEHRVADLDGGPFGGLVLADRRAYGQTEVSFYRRVRTVADAPAGG